MAKPRYALGVMPSQTNGSWWAEASRSDFTNTVAQREWPRMRTSRFGWPHVTLAVGRSEPNSLEAYRAAKRERERLAAGR